MSNNKQSSIDFLIKQKEKYGMIINDDLRIAKAMHQEEVEDFTFEWQRQKTMTINEFYNKTFGGNNG